MLKGFTNIALYGLDNSGGSNYETGNSDVIMIASINNDTKEVRLVSVYRDTYLSVGDGKYYKANYAYMHGGVSQSVAMLNTNLDLDIEDYICVNWVAMAKIIDELGGIDIEISEEEAYNINECTIEIDMLTGYSTPKVTGSGMTHLDGTQATGYARIRAMAGDDFMRASRQRIVLQAMVDKIKAADAKTLVAIANRVLDDVKTFLTLPEIMALSTHVREYSIAGTTGFPMELTTGSTSAGSSVIALELDNNVAALHQYLFGEEDYQVSKAVQKISDSIVEETGCSYDSQDAYNLDQWLEKSDPEWEKNHSTENSENEE